jgi:hypothetical protein
MLRSVDIPRLRADLRVLWRSAGLRRAPVLQSMPVRGPELLDFLGLLQFGRRQQDDYSPGFF